MVSNGTRAAFRPSTQRLTPGTLWPSSENLAGEVELAVEFKRSRLDGEGTGGRPRRFGLVDDANLHALFGQPKGKDQTSRTSAGNQDIAALHLVLHQQGNDHQGRNGETSSQNTDWVFLSSSQEFRSSFTVNNSIRKA